MSDEYSIAEADLFRKRFGQARYDRFREKLHAFVYPQLAANPFYGPNIKKLKGELAGFFRYRIGRYRIFYTVEEREKIVIVHDVKDRRDAYG